MQTKSKIILSIVSICLVVLFSGCGSSSSPSSYKVTLEVWGLFDDSAVFDSIIGKYKAINPYVTDIKYKKLTQDTYKQDILDALASGQGPDIILIQNTWLPSFENKLVPAPVLVTNEQEVRTNFPDVVADNFLDGANVYALPLSVDSLALYYNKDMFNAAGITAAPKTWNDFSTDVGELTKISQTGDITQSGAAMGNSESLTDGGINRASDILELLMYQNGATMPSPENHQSVFEQGVVGPDGRVVQAGANALNYYTQFARISSPAYTWSPRMHYSIDAFTQGTAAMMLNYSWQLATVRSQNPKLNFAVAPVPQVNPDNPVNFANYWAYAVVKNKLQPADAAGQGGGSMSTVQNQARVHEAWEFLKFLTMKNNGTVHLVNAVTKNSKDFPEAMDPAAVYLNTTQKPAARRDLIDQQKSNPDLSPFALGNLIAKSWYRLDPDATDSVMTGAIDSVNKGTAPSDALILASSRINTINK